MFGGNSADIEGQSEARRSPDAGLQDSGANSRLVSDALSSTWTAAASGDRQIALDGNESTRVKKGYSEAGRPDIESGLFDEKAPISHFDQVAPGVYRSGRPNGEEGVRQAVEKVWGDNQFNAAHAEQTAIIELRGPAKGKFYQANEDEVNREAEYSAQLGITHARFPMQTHDHLKPDFIQSVLDYIDQQKDEGKRVLIHCYHGTDRTGTISAAYEVTHDPQMKSLLQSNPDEAFKQALKTMTDNGFSSASFPELTQSLREFVDFEHRQLAGPASQDSTSDTAAAQYVEIPPIWKQTA
jgi:protein tyrosine/serine phosphatase